MANLEDVKADTAESYQERILRVLLHIQNNLDSTISLDDLARVACFSPYHFHRIFRGMVGESVKEHVRRLRLERAAQRLQSSDQPIITIAFDAGYASQEAFTRAFEAMLSATPAVWRKDRTRAVEPRSMLARKVRSIMEVAIKQFEKMRVAFVRHTGPYDEVGKAWERLCAWAGTKGLLGPNTRFCGISYDDPGITPSEKLRYDAAIAVPAAIQGEGEIGVQDVEPGDYAVTLHKGPYNGLAETYAQLCGEWLPNSDREAKTAPAVEIYLNSPDATPPEKLLTEVCIPLT